MLALALVLVLVSVLVLTLLQYVYRFLQGLGVRLSRWQPHSRWRHPADVSESRLAFYNKRQAMMGTYPAWENQGRRSRRRTQ